jgi:hypothetical protein
MSGSVTDQVEPPCRTSSGAGQSRFKIISRTFSTSSRERVPRRPWLADELRSRTRDLPLAACRANLPPITPARGTRRAPGSGCLPVALAAAVANPWSPLLEINLTADPADPAPSDRTTSSRSWACSLRRPSRLASVRGQGVSDHHRVPAARSGGPLHRLHARTRRHLRSHK